MGLETVRYATVAVNAPAGRGPAGAELGYHYAIPEPLRGRLLPGQMVWVPFGERRLAGIITGLADEAPPLEIKAIEALIAEEPVVIPSQIALAAWMAREYLTPFGRALWSMLPPGLGRNSETFVAAMDDLPDGLTLTSNQRVLLSALQGQGAVPMGRVANLARVTGWRTALAALIEKGLVRRWEGERPPAVRPKMEWFVRLAAGSEQAAPPPERATKQRAAYEYLLAHRPREEDGGWLPLAGVLAASGATRGVAEALAAHGLVELDERRAWRDPLAGREFVLAEPPRLTPEQALAMQALEPALDERKHEVFLLHGVTGSGKTEIYLQAVARVLAQGRRAIILVPEISLTPQTIRRFAARFPGRLVPWHSHLSPGERYDQWRRIMHGEVDVIIGARSAILAPVRDLGLVVVDEEHEDSYKQDHTPRYHAREAAIALARHAGACVILGSATPDLVSAYRARTGAYHLLSLPQRVLSHRRQLEEHLARHNLPALPHLHPLTGAHDDVLYARLPPVEVVDLRRELREGNRSIFSRALVRAVEQALADHEQVILFLNRRGSATFVMCRDCGYTLTCPRCQVPLTYHATRQEMVCHHCNHHRPVAQVCPNCLGRRIKFFGLGTQKVVEAAHELFPQARIVRWDRDAINRRDSHEELMRQFMAHEADVMVGTQMIAKGLDLPLVTVVGVISADTAIHLPDYRAAEHTFQLLAQVAGRAGRSPLGGRVIVQTYTPEHFAIQAASRHDYQAFAEHELAFRQEHRYPPYGRLVRLIYADADPSQARQQACTFASKLHEAIRRLGQPGVELIGPAPCPIERLREQWRWHIIIRTADPAALFAELPLPHGWRIDVDPISFM